jgi:hypothetical protein
MATRLGIVVDNPELQAIVSEERRRAAEHRPEPRAAPTPSPRKPRRPRPPRSRSQER